MKKKWIIALILILSYQNTKGEEIVKLFKQAEKNLLLGKKFSFNQEYYDQLNKALKKNRFLNLNSQISYSRIDTKLTHPYSFSSIAISDDIDLFNKTQYDIRINEIQKEKSNVLVKKDKQLLFKNILDLYTSFLMYNELLKLQKEKINWIRKNLRFTQKAISRGIFPSIESSKWESQLIKEEEKLVNYKGNINAIEKNLKTLCGIKEVKLEKVKLPNKLENLQSLKAKVLQNNPDLQLLELDRNILKTTYLKEKNYWLPTLSIFSEYQINKDPTGNGNQYSIGASLNFKVFNNGKKYKLLSIKTKEKTLNILKHQEKIRLIQEINSLYSSISSGLESLSLLKKRCRALKDILDKYEKAYEMKLCDFTILDNYYKEYASAKESYIKTKYRIYFKYQLLKHLSKGDIYR